MAIITPNVNPTASLSMPLITPGGPMVGVEKSNPYEHSQGKQEKDATGAIVTPATKRATAIHNAGHDNDRVI